ncbi:MAG: 3-alpha,7-alpha,12-alpha-trihydroxy-5-beta-cholest-24-enoyl-CoA hydratase [Comamonadaceae bacterium]|nr:MAG: 3-alpha,7-alpha,12-alpha-trihydroxy-5-beta-cholest-24-enoyl-CoA hydratase [Comamonadaceae bacterium]
MPLPLDERLLSFAIPQARRRYERIDCARYALSVGLGQDPLDESQLAHVLPDRPMRVLPTQAIVLGSPGFWLGDPATGVDIAQVLHGEQRLRLMRPLPDSGEMLGRSAVRRVVDQGPGRAALVVTGTQLVDERSGDLYAEMESTTYIRGAGGFGGASGPVHAAPQDPARPPDAAVTVATRPEQALWYRLNGDFNPIHADPALARRAGFEQPILHGLCTLGIATQAVLRTWAQGDPAAFRSLSCRFAAPVFPGETLSVEMWRAESAFRCRVIERDRVVLRGSLQLASG